MQITSTGHAGLFVETEGGSILCDPWFTPAYFGAWFPFPRTDTLDVARVSSPDYLYVSHGHLDHLDLTWLAAHVDPATPVLLPAFHIPQLRDLLGGIGFHDFIDVPDSERVELGPGLAVAIIALDEPNIGPMGDSALLVTDGTTTIFNQNDAHPYELPAIEGFARVDGHFLQHSGAIWYPMVYEMPEEERAAEVAASRARRYDRACGYVELVGAPHVFPTAGPPCFLDDELFACNDLPGNPTIFPDATAFLAELGRRRLGTGHLLIPGSTATLVGDRCEVTHPVPDAEVEAVFADKEAYLRAYQRDMADVIAAERASWPTDRSDLGAGLASWLDPLLEKAPLTRANVAGDIGLDAGDDRFVIDMGEGLVRPWAPDEPDPTYVFRTERPLLESMVRRRVPDWCNELFLSCRFTTARRGAYNEAVYTFFKSLSPERMAFAEETYATRLAANPEDWAVVDGWEVQARCPHQGASLRRVGSVADGVLTCALHGFRFDLETGRCLDAEGVVLHVRGPTEPHEG